MPMWRSHVTFPDPVTLKIHPFDLCINKNAGLIHGSTTRMKNQWMKLIGAEYH